MFVYMGGTTVNPRGTKWWRNPSTLEEIQNSRQFDLVFDQLLRFFTSIPWVRDPGQR